MNISEHPMIEKMKRREEILWLNPNMDNKLSDEMTKDDIKEASERLKRFAPYLSAVFPDTGDGIIESKLMKIPKMKGALERENGMSLDGELYLKCDCNLPISGSIKARGGIYEVLHFAEEIALKSGMLNISDDYSILADEKFKKLFSEYSIAVGSTGNLGLSIGIMGAKLGFDVSVHMSSDAKQWKKDLLREKGATVVEYAGDYGKAVAEGRRQAENDPRCHFVDDENSKTLLLGYSVAAERLEKQLEDEGIKVDANHPLFVYLPCGVGGGPGGVAYGLKQIYGENVHCFFAEPVEVPCMLLGVMTGRHEEICVQDIGLTGKTTADGLAVSRPSGLVGRLVGNLLDGLYSVSDEKMERFVADLYDTEGVFVEPSGTAGFAGFYFIRQYEEYQSDKMKNSTHIIWSTGGNMVPADEREKFLRGR